MVANTRRKQLALITFWWITKLYWLILTLLQGVKAIVASLLTAAQMYESLPNRLYDPRLYITVGKHYITE